MKKALILFFLCSIIIGVNAQSSSLIGTAADNEYSMAMCADNAGNVFIGATNNNEPWVLKRDVNNNLVWSQKLNTVAVGFSSDVSYIDIIGDTIFGCGWLKTGASIKGALIFKLNATTGALYWVKSEATSKTYLSTMKYANGKYFVTGSQTNNANGYGGKVMAISSATGATIWETPSIGLTFPGYGIDYLDDFTSASDMVNGKMFITGRSYVNATATNMRTLLIGVSDQGVVFLTKYLEFNPATAPDARFYGACIEYDGPDSLVILQHGDDICGSSSCTDFKVGLVKTDLFGNVSWCKEYDVSSVASEVGRGLTVTSNAYVFYGFGNYNQSNSKLFVIKTNKSGVVQASKLVSFGTGNLGHTCGPLTTTGSNVYKNGKHYIPGSFFTTNANSRDIIQLVLNDNLDDALGCFNVASVNVSTTTHPPYSNVLNTNLPADQVSFSLNPAPALLNYVSPCTASVTFSQNSSCASSIITASVPTIANPTFVWSNGATGATVTATNNDTLFVSVLNPLTCCIVVDTIVPVFTVSNLSVQLPNDTTICLGASSNFTLTPVVSSTTASLTYLWSNQTTNSTLNVSQSGTYWVSVSNGCQTLSDTINITIAAIPTLTSPLSYTICNGQSPNINLTSSVPASFTWQAQNNSAVTGETTISTSGASIQDMLVNNTALNQNVTYQISLATPTCTNTQNITVSVLPALPAPVISASGPTALCTGASVTLSSNYPTGNLWSTNATSNSIVVSSPGTITLTVQLGQCTSPTTSIQITQVNAPIPTAMLSGAGTFCQGQSIDPVVVNFSGTAPWTLSYTLNGVAQAPVTTSNPTFTLGQTPGTYALSNLQDANCANLLSNTIQLTVEPVPNVSLNALTLCSGTSGTLSASVDLPGGTYQWLPTGQSTASIVVSPLIATTYGVIYTLNGCSNTDSTLVVVDPIPNVSFIADTLNGCAPLAVQFTSTSNGDPNSCIWSLSNGQTLTGCNPSYVFNQPGCFDVTLTTSINGCSASAISSQLICIENNPLTLFNANPSLINQDNATVQFFNLSSGAASYYWDFGDNTSATVANPAHLYAANGSTYEVTLVSTSAFGCTSSYSLTIAYEEGIIYYVPNSFTPDGDQFNQVFLPVFSSGLDPQSYQLQIFNRWGELLFESHDVQEGWDGTYPYDNGVAPDGIYTWRINFNLKSSNEPKVLTGHLNVLR
jgi:gliding motility-associated-like protein